MLWVSSPMIIEEGSVVLNYAPNPWWCLVESYSCYVYVMLQEERKMMLNSDEISVPELIWSSSHIKAQIYLIYAQNWVFRRIFFWPVQVDAWKRQAERAEEGKKSNESERLEYAPIVQLLW